MELYTNRLHQFGCAVPERVNSTRLKERLLSHISDLRSYNDDKEVILSFTDCVNTAMNFTLVCNHDADAMHLARTAVIIRREISKQSQNFNGSFKTDWQEKSVPESLLALVSIISGGPNIQSQVDQSKTENSAAVSISQLIAFNYAKHHKSTHNKAARHNKASESPLPIYLALVVHAETRKKSLKGFIDLDFAFRMTG